MPANESVQGQLWWALRGPLKLAGSSRPGPAFDFDAAFANGLTQVVSLLGPTSVDSAPLATTSYDLEDLHGVEAPAGSAVEWERVTEAATEVRRLLDSGEGVLVHCLGGTGRTGTVIGAVLGSYDMTLDDVASWLNAVHVLRSQPGWPECGWQQDALAVLQQH